MGGMEEGKERGKWCNYTTVSKYLKTLDIARISKINLLES